MIRPPVSLRSTSVLRDASYNSPTQRRPDFSCACLLQVSKQPVEGGSIHSMLLPAVEITYMPGAADLGSPWLRRFHYGFIDADREKDCPVFTVLAFECSMHFALHPSALHRGIGQNDH